jgi:glycosyltransferase involved in cell wall biosynthesis
MGTPYRSEDMTGGVYALSEEGRSRFEAFPDLIADDQFVQQLFERSERKSVEGAEFVVQTPRALSGLLLMRARVYRGNRELARSGLSRVDPPASGTKSALRRALEPAMIPAVAVYGSVNILAKAFARRPARHRWERDETSRRVPDTPTLPGTVATEGTIGICYVTSHYPALSHTFVMREIMGVRAAGLRVETVSVHKADQRELLAQADKQEAARTWNILPLDSPAFLKAHARAALGHPYAYFRTLARAVSCAPRGARDRLWQLFYFAEAIALWDHSGSAGARHLHAHLANVASDVSLLACAFGKTAEPTKGWRWSFTMHGPTELYSTEKFNLPHKVATADGVLCISDYTRSQLMYLSSPQHWEKLHVVHCGVDMERYPYVAPRQGAGLSVLCVGRLVPQKGLDMLMEAVDVLARRDVDIRLVLVGSGPLEASLRRKVRHLGLEERVRFEGAVGQDDIGRYYAEADLFCLPSFAEGVPVVLMEAMATGRPVVATRIAGVPELVDDGVSGLLVAPGSVEQLVTALERLASSTELRERMGLAGRQKVEQDFDSRRCAEQAADAFRAMAGPAGIPT